MRASQPASPQHRRRLRWLGLFWTAGLVAIGLWAHARSGVWLARYWQSQLTEISADRAAIVLDRIAQLGADGIPVLVAELDNPRPELATAARQRLEEMLEEWEQLPRWQAGRGAALLAEALAGHCESFGAGGQRNAADLAARLLGCPKDDSVGRTQRMLADCERVFRATQLRPRPTPVPDRPAPAAEEHESPRVAEAGVVRPATHLSGNDLPAAGGDGVHETGPNPLRRRPSIADSNEPDRLAESDARPLVKSQPVAPQAGRSAEPPAVLANHPMKPRQPDGAEGVPADAVAVMRGLHSADRAGIQRAEAELTRRGFNEVQIELARRLFAPDPEVRRQLARALPGLQSVPSAPWLLWLAKDQDAEVRLLAITLLATTGDPATLSEVQRLAQSDSDPRVQEQGLRLARLNGSGAK